MVKNGKELISNFNHIRELKEGEIEMCRRRHVTKGVEGVCPKIFPKEANNYSINFAQESEFLAISAFWFYSNTYE